jgi:formate hydrogenlyase subunit 6/NADH:ubiquinone oxidoreductase subunit I
MKEQQADSSGRRASQSFKISLLVCISCMLPLDPLRSL